MPVDSHRDEKNHERERGKVLMPDLPVVCTLSPEALAARREGLLADLVRRAQTLEELACGHRLTFAATDKVLAMILKTVTSERHCCQFLRFQITVEPRGGPIALELTGPHVQGVRSGALAVVTRGWSSYDCPIRTLRDAVPANADPAEDEHADHGPDCKRSERRRIGRGDALSTQRAQQQ